jgi:hypothetical protein
MKSQISIIKKLNREPSWETLLLSYSGKNRLSSLTTEKYVEMAIHYVPKSILSEAVSFSLEVNGFDYEVPTELLAKYPPRYPREIIELEWNSRTNQWINQFIKNFEQSRYLSRKQRLNALDNIRKAIALYVILNSADEDLIFRDD